MSSELNYNHSMREFFENYAEHLSSVVITLESQIIGIVVDDLSSIQNKLMVLAQLLATPVGWSYTVEEGQALYSQLRRQIYPSEGIDNALSGLGAALELSAATQNNSIDLALNIIAGASAVSMILIAATFALSTYRNQKLREEVVDGALAAINRVSQRASAQDYSHVVGGIMGVLQIIESRHNIVGLKMRAGQTEVSLTSS
jgi:hypothetical protein